MEIISLQKGMEAPAFTLTGADGKEHSLSDYLGQKVILYFYPKDNTAGCTTEAMDFKANFDSFTDQNTVILGISRDSVASHVKFINKLELPFMLLSDPDETVCNLYEVIKEKNMYGKKYFGIERSTFVIDELGMIREIYRKVKVNGHVACLLNDH